MQLATYNPFRDLLRVDKELSDVLERSWSLAPAFADIPIVDMYIKDDQLIAETSLPQFKKEEIQVTATEEGLEISAEHKTKQAEKDEGRRYLLKESSRSFWRRLYLPPEAQTDKVECAFKEGRLTITMPITVAPKPKAITVK
jgi:HSP20 family protein